jgi:hypothetical protein
MGRPRLPFTFSWPSRDSGFVRSSRGKVAACGNKDYPAHNYEQKDNASNEDGARQIKLFHRFGGSNLTDGMRVAGIYNQDSTTYSKHLNKRTPAKEVILPIASAASLGTALKISQDHPPALLSFASFQ